MIDIHCHLLYGLDDGAATLDESVQMAEMAIADGITHAIGTPHANSEFPLRPDVIRARCLELQARVGAKLVLGTGCDFHLSFENLRDIETNQKKYTLNQKNYLLVEFADFSIPPAIDDSLHTLQLSGLNLIVTHPERNPLIRHQPERLWRWMRQGCYVQLTAQSLLGRFGREAAHAARKWLEEDRVHFFASDAHDLKNRPMLLREAFEMVCTIRGENVAEVLFTENPLAVFEGRPLPYRPEPPVEETAATKKRKRFFFF